MYKFKDSAVTKDYYLQRYRERSELRKMITFVFWMIFVFWLVNGALYAHGKQITWTYYICRTIVLAIVLVSILKLTKLKFFQNITQGNRIFYVDCVTFVPLAMMLTVLVSLGSKAGIPMSQEDPLGAYFSAYDISFNIIWTLPFTDFLITNWIFKVFYFLAFWAPINVLRVIYFPTTYGLFNAFRMLVYAFVVVFFQERSSRLNFVIKRARQKKIEMFESILKRIQEQIIVFNRKMEIKYSNVTTGGILEEGTSPKNTQSPGDILRNITSLRLLSGSIVNPNLAKMFENDSPSHINLIQRLDQIVKNDEFYKELGKRDYIQIEGKASISSRSSMISLSPETRYFTLQLFTNCLHEEECLVVIIKDITDHISMLQEKTDLQSNLLSSLSHELKTPLGISLGLIERAVEDHKTPLELSKNYLMPALNYGNMLTCFINDVLDFNKIQQNQFLLKVDYFCIENVLEEVMKLFTMSLEKKNLRFQIDYDESARTVINSDPQRLKQILVNLVGNAIKYTMRGTITLGFKHTDDSFSFYVQDSGIGIQEEELRVLSEKLESTNFCVRVNENSTGAGIGLITANAIAKRLNPNMSRGLIIESAFGVGSKFSFAIEDITRKSKVRRGTIIEFKYEDGASPEGKISPVLISSFRNSNDLLSFQHIPSAKKNKLGGRHYSSSSGEFEVLQILQPQEEGCRCKRILVADDEVFNTVAVEMICKPFGFSVDCAFNGQQAIELIQKRASETCCDDCKPYSMIIMDCNMPIMDGYETTRCIKDSIKAGTWKDMIVVGCTAYEGIEKIEECLRSGMDTYVKKPLDRNKFTQLLGMYNLKV